MKWICLAPLIVLVASCLPATQTIVELDVADGVGRGLGTLVVTVKSENGQVRYLEPHDIDNRWSWPAEIPVSPMGGDASRRFLFSATLSDDEREGDIVVRASLGFAEATEFRVQLRFEESCRGLPCGPGSTCVAGTCVSIYDDNECERELPAGVLCDVDTGCGCPDNYACLDLEDVQESPGPTCLRNVERSICTGASDCAADEHCGRNGECHAATSTVCAPRRSGDAAVNANCSANVGCAMGLVCVSIVSADLDDELNFTSQSGNRCRPGCNPCESNSTCVAPNECIPLRDGGGFCFRNGVARETEPCDSTSLCGLGLSCESGRCARACRADFPEDVDGCALRSPDCGTGDVCVAANAEHRILGLCEVGSENFLSPEGGLCTLGGSCPCPMNCDSTASEEPDPDDPEPREPDIRICRRPGITCADCEARDLVCLTRDERTNEGIEATLVVCIAPGSLRDFDPCQNHEDCQSGYCNPDDGICLPAR